MKIFFVGAFVVLAVGLAALVTAALTIHRHDAEHEARLDRMRAGLMQAPEGAYREWLDRYRVSRQEERRALEALVEADARLRAVERETTEKLVRADASADEKDRIETVATVRREAIDLEAEAALRDALTRDEYSFFHSRFGDASLAVQLAGYWRAKAAAR